MEGSKKIVSFVKEYIALAKGEETEAVAIKVRRQADSALNTHFHKEKGKLISFEDRIVEAEEKLELARKNNLSPILNQDAYVVTLLRAINDVTLAKEAHEAQTLLVDTLESELKKVQE